jgi:hypothetical protein
MVPVIMKLLVLGNCQAGGLADSLEILAPGIEVGRELLSNDVATLRAELRKQSKSLKGRVILHDSVQNIIDFHPQLQGILPDDTIVVPTLTFAAFHPDIQYCFVDGKVVKNGLDSDWNSRIMLWAYLNGLSKVESRFLFHEDVYRSLGYLNEWASSTGLLRASFDKYGFDCGRWMRSVQRDGVFMYGINHPFPLAISQLATQICEREISGNYEPLEDAHKYVTDYLAHIVWPVYPEIAEELGVEGTYRWRVGRKYAHLDEFISLCFDSWDSIKLRKREINLMPTFSEQDNVVLSTMSGRG